MIAGQPTAAADPTEGAFDDPAPELNGEAFLPLLGHDDLDGDGGRRADALASIGAVGKAMRQERPQTA